jgi:hypothetical protein
MGGDGFFHQSDLHHRNNHHFTNTLGNISASMNERVIERRIAENIKETERALREFQQ